MYKPYVQNVNDWVEYYQSGSKANKDTGEGTGGIGAESGSTANPVEKAVANNIKMIESKMSNGQMTSAIPSEQTVAQAIAKTGRRRKRRKTRRRKPGRKRKKVKKVKKRRKKVTRKKKKKRKRPKKKERDLFDN
jgi:hypothetical protein